MSQAFDKLSELKEWLIFQKEKANKELYECEHATWEKYKGSITDHRNDHAKITGKIIACNDILEYIEKLKEE